MMDKIGHAFDVVFGALVSPTAIALIDILALLIAFIPAAYYSSRIMVGNAGAVERIVHSKGALARLTLLCVLVALLQMLKIPLAMKLVASLIILFASIFIALYYIS
jgi:hypothetical protein